MRKALSILAVAWSALSAHGGSIPPSSRSVVERLERAPGFVENRGQVDGRVRYYRSTSRHAVWLTRSSLVFELREGSLQGSTDGPPTPTVVTQRFIRGSPHPEIRAEKELPGLLRYVRRERMGRRAEARTFGTVVYESIWPGIDMRLLPNGLDVEQQFIVHPGARPQQIRVTYGREVKLRLAQDGSLLVEAPAMRWTQTAPRIFQETVAGPVAIQGTYSVAGDTAFSFVVGAYDPNLPLIIDPTLLFASYLGGADDDKGEGIVVDNAGNVYVTGSTYSLNFPIAAALQPVKGWGLDVFVTKFSSTGALIYSTYIGGDGYDIGRDIAVDQSGNVFVAGVTQSTDFPVLNPIQAVARGNSDAFLLKLSPLGGLVFSTYLGGSAGDDGTGVAVDAGGRPFVSGATYSTDFPLSRPIQSAYGGAKDAFLSVFAADGSTLDFSTYLGGADAEAAIAVATGPSGDAYLTGATRSVDFPTRDALQNTLANPPFNSAFVTRVDPAAGTLAFSTYLGGTGTDVGTDIAVDGLGNAYVVGVTASVDFPVMNPYQATPHDASEIFVSKLSADGSRLLYSTYFGGNNADAGAAIAVDATGNVFIAGSTNSSDFPVRGAWQDEIPHPGGGIYSAFISALTPDGSSVLFSTYHGGDEDVTAQDIALGSTGDVYATGWTQADDMPVANPFQAVRGGWFDAWVVKALVTAGPGFSLVGVTPDQAGDLGTVSLTIFGSGFEPGATVKLVKGPRQLVPTVSGVDDFGGVVSAIFDLAGQERGSWDVVVTNPDGTSGSLPNGFTIVEGQRARIWVEVSGRERARIGRPTTYAILFGNTGNMNAYGVPIWIGGIPKDAEWKLEFELTEPPSPDPSTPLDFSVVPVHIETADEILIPLYIGLVPPGHTGALRITLTVPDARQFELRAWACPPWSQSPVEVAAVNCTIEVLEFAFSEIVSATIPGVGCANSVREFVINSQLEIFSTASQAAVQGDITAGATAFSVTQIFFAGLEAALVCGAIAVPPAQAAITVVKWVNAGLNLADLASTCSDIAQHAAQSSLSILTVTSIDPNVKYGSQGVGPPRYVAYQQPLRYTILFENLPSATAAAQEVVVTDQLDAPVMDLNTLRFGALTFGDRQVDPVPGADRLSVDLDLRPGRPLIARLRGSLDPTTGIITWRLSAIDPATGALPSDPDLGLLPPNTTPPAGEGSVMFTVMPNPTAASGAQIRNRANIVFDVNPAITTATWVNTLDRAPPSSSVSPAPSPQENVSFPISWSGSDAESGILDYTIYVARDGGTYTPWVSMTSATTGTFTGEKGHTYSFYSVARDLAGNYEDAPPQPDTRVQVAGGLGALLWILIGLGIALVALILYLIFR